MSRTTLATWEEWTTSGAWASTDDRAFPPSSGLLGEMLTMLRDPDVEVAHLIRVISRDQSLAARVLRMANSAAFAPMVEVGSINLAVVRLGTESVRRALLAVCFASWAMPIDSRSGPLRTHIAHGILTGTLARHIAQTTFTDGDEAFAHGLLHDIGKLLLVRLRVEFMRRGGMRPTADEYARVEQAHHAEIGAMGMQLWGLPLLLRETTQWHHDPLSAPTYPRAAALTYVANMLAHRYAESEDRSLELATDPSMIGLGLSEVWLAQSDKQSARFLESADDLLSFC